MNINKIRQGSLTGIGDATTMVQDGDPARSASDNPHWLSLVARLASPRSEFRATRLVALATVLLAIAFLVLGFLTLSQDFVDRRDQRALAAQTSDSALAEDLEILKGDLSRSIETVQRAGTDLAAAMSGSLAESEDPADALAAAVIDAGIADTVPAINRVFYQDPVSQVIAVDRFGNARGNPRDEGFDTRPAISADGSTPFADEQGQAFVLDGIAAYFPVADIDGWIVLILNGDEMAVGSDFVELTAAEVAPEIRYGEEVAQVIAAQPFTDRTFVAQVERELPGGEPVGWLPLLLRVLAVLAGLGAIALLGHFVHRLYGAASERMATAEVSGAAGAHFEENIIGVVELNEMGIITGVNQAYCEQVGRGRDELIGKSLISLTEPNDRSRHLAAIDRLMAGAAQKAQVEHRVLKEGDEAEAWVLEHLSRVDTSDGSKILVQSQDITFRRYATWELAKQALHDELTGLANRAMLVHRLRTALNQGPDADGEFPTVGVMYIDVDRFKLVNDSLGHDVGDRLLKHVGARMETAVRVADTVSRFGGDEFVVLCDRLTGVSEAMAVAERIRASLTAPYTDDGSTIHPTLSIGIAVSKAGEMTADDLLRDADTAMYRAKERGRNRVEVFDEGMRKLLVEQMTLETELRDAIDNEEIAMYFQPIVDSATHATAGFEALIRWPHPTRGLLTPGQFLGVAEEAGLQGRLDNVALKLTCEQMAKWAARYPLANHLYVSANKVPKNFPKFVEQIRDIVGSTGLPTGLLAVEVVEHALLDDADGALQAIEQLKAMGVRVAIDDFGTGYSSLSYLTQFRPTTLKIDRAFVSLLPDDAATASVVQAITEMALALDINVIAEGVETRDQADMLARIGVPYFQGYLFAKPRPAHEIEEWFEANLELGAADVKYAIEAESRRARLSVVPDRPRSA